MAKIDAAYNYLMTTYGKTTGSRYDSHKKSELRSVYNNIIKTNKESPLYKITQGEKATEFALDIKQSSHRMQNVLSSLSENGDDISSILNKKVAVSSDEDAVTVTYVGAESTEDVPTFDISVKKLATPQVNQGNFLNRQDHSFEEGSFTFDLDTTTNSYEFQLNVNPGDNNYDVQSKIARLINQSDVGLSAEILMNDKGQSALKIESKQTGLSENEESLFRIQSGSSWNEVNTLGIGNITSPASNSVFVLNDKEHSSLSNTFTINKAFEITLHKPTAEDSSAHIGFKANTEAISDRIEEMISAYNGLAAVGLKYSATQHSSKLFREVTAIGKTFEEPLSEMGISSDEDGLLHLERSVFADAISGADSDKHFKTLNNFKKALTAEAQKTSINPMNYVDKVIVEYKNPGKTFAAPYAPSAYAGILVDKFL